MIDTDFILGMIKEERRNQDIKWGEQNHDVFKWLAILGEEVGEANKAALEADFIKNPNMLPSLYRQLLGGLTYELIQVAAVAVAMIESLERNRNENEG